MFIATCVALVLVILITLSGGLRARASENVSTYDTTYDYLYPNVSVMFYNASDIYTASVVSVDNPPQLQLLVSEPYSGIDYIPVTDPSTGVIQSYNLIPPTGGLGSTTYTITTPYYVVSDFILPITLTEDNAEWVVQLMPSSASGIVFVNYTGTPSALYSYLQTNYAGSLVVQMRVTYESLSEIQVRKLDANTYANNIRQGLDPDTYYDGGFADGYNSGYTAGYGVGERDGHDEGYADGKLAGYDEGYVIGTANGREAGYREGYDEAVAQGADLNPFAWLLNMLDSILRFEIIPLGKNGITVGGIISIVLAIPLLRLVLDMFAGG